MGKSSAPRRISTRDRNPRPHGQRLGSLYAVDEVEPSLLSPSSSLLFSSSAGSCIWLDAAIEAFVVWGVEEPDVRCTCYKQASQMVSWRVSLECRDRAQDYCIHTTLSAQPWILGGAQKAVTIGEPGGESRGALLSPQSAATGEDDMIPIFGTSARKRCAW